jgi:hypothetical protein
MKIQEIKSRNEKRNNIEEDTILDTLRGIANKSIKKDEMEQRYQINEKEK